MIGIMAAMAEELHELVEEIRVSNPGTLKERLHGGRVFYEGRLFGKDVVLVLSRMGKVAAATTATALIHEHRVDRIIFTGVAGGADPLLRVGDVVVGTGFYQHDMDASPLFPRHEIPLLGVQSFMADRALRESARKAAEDFLSRGIGSEIPAEALREFHLIGPKVVEGDIASGDKFFARKSDLEELRSRLPYVACVEMEGAAVAQVCHEYGVPLAVIRTISDCADESSPVDFARFIRSVASRYSFGILKRMLA